MVEYPSQFPGLVFEGPRCGVLEIILSRPGKLNALDRQSHHDLTYVWRTIDADDDVDAVLVRGEGGNFAAGSDLSVIEDLARDFSKLFGMVQEGRDLVYNIINCSKPIVSAINGPAVGAGLAVGLLADVPIAARTAKIIDGHTRLGIAAGDHAVVIWPLLCGMAKAKYHLLTCEPVSGPEAERIGLVALCVEPDDLEAKAREVADRLARGSRSAIRWTKYALNNWLRTAGPAFDTSLALEMLGMTGPDFANALSEMRQRSAATHNHA
jgi:enoyl-CoA hydratase